MATLSAQDFKRIYEAELDYVWNSLRRLGVASAHLEDLTHDVFSVAWKKLAHYDAARPIRPWLFGIAMRLASDFRQLAWQSREVGADDVDAEDSAPTSDEWVARRQAQAMVKKALATMPMERRAVFVMHELDGIAIPEVAQVLDVPLNTAYSRLRLARRDFAEAVEQLKQGGTPAMSKGRSTAGAEGEHAA
ncbi:MAG: sigma-70 family RNA polymerase sigma factor [Myxococcaceae bacterium]|nr:sigma-70 family RNA polymerase sigma factor [Myxococcaceae bacterium]